MEFNLAFKGLIDYCVIVSDLQNVIDVVIVIVNVVVFFCCRLRHQFTVNVS